MNETMKNALLTIVLLASGAAMNAADRCGTPAPSAALRALMQSNDSFWQNSPHRLSPTDVVIPLQFNVIRRNDGSGDVTDAQIFNQIDVMNERFRSSRLRFSLRGVSRTNNSAWAAGGNESTMKSSLAVSVATTLNVYLCPDYQFLGVATFPGMYSESSHMHGVIVRSSTLPGGNELNFNLGLTLVHEVGHYVGLFHTFQDGCSEPNDYVADTPQHLTNYGKPPASTNTCAAPGNDPVHNYMNYTDDAWMNQFTAGQLERAYAQTSALRPTLWSAGMSTSTLSNISTRVKVEGGGNVAIAGFYISGSGTRPVLMRGMGPWLSGFGLAGLPNPMLTVTTSNGTAVASNDDWKNPSSNEPIIIATGRPPVSDLEAAVKVDLSAGGYTAVLSPSPGSGGGIGLVEIYDLASNAQPNRIVNISTRGWVGTGNEVLIGGFYTSGGFKKVLIRAIGPTLSNFGIPNPLANPKITLKKSIGSQQVIIGVNENWTSVWNPNELAAAISQTYAFGAPNSNEAMMVKILDPGGYTVIVEAESGAHGIALVEVYDVNAY